MGRNKHRRGRIRRATPDAAEAMVAWANLVRAIVVTMREADAGNDVILSFLDTLDIANIEVLEGNTLDFALHVTDACRQALPSND